MARRGRRLGFLLPGLLVLAVPRGPASGQDVLEGLQSLAMENAELYVAPLADGLGIAMGTGFARTGRVHGILGFSVGVRVVAALPSEEAGTFTPILPGSVTFRGTTFSDPYEPVGGALTSATVVGDGPGVVLRPRGEYLAALQLAGENPDDYTLSFPDGLDLPAVPFAVVEGALGMGMGTEITARFLPSYEIASEVGAVSARGFGVRHSLTSWIPGPTPLLDLAVYAGWQRFQVGDYLDAKAVAYGLVASAGLGPLRVYGSGGLSRADIDVQYEVRNPSGNPALPPDGTSFSFQREVPSSFRGAVGVGLSLPLLEVSAEYGLADFNTASVQFGIHFR